MHASWTIPRRRATEKARAANAQHVAMHKPDSELPDALDPRPRVRNAQEEADFREALRRHELRKRLAALDQPGTTRLPGPHEQAAAEVEERRKAEDEAGPLDPLAGGTRRLRSPLEEAMFMAQRWRALSQRREPRDQ